MGKVSEAFEWLERARGRLYDFHQMLGHLDLQMSEAVQRLHDAGHAELADLARGSVRASLAGEASKQRWLTEIDTWLHSSPDVS